MKILRTAPAGHKSLKDARPLHKNMIFYEVVKLHKNPKTEKLVWDIDQLKPLSATVALKGFN